MATNQNTINFLKITGVLVLAVVAFWYLGQATGQAATPVVQTATGSYIGNGTTRTVTGLGFLPESLMIKGDDDKLHTVYSAASMPAGSAFYFGKASNSLPRAITSLSSNGFSVGNNKEVNQKGVTYYWAASGGGIGLGVKSGTYAGDGSNQRAITGLGFTPETIWIKGDNNELAVDLSVAVTPPAAYPIQSLDADGFTIGSDKSVNAKKTDYYYVAFGHVSGAIASGLYVGDGSEFRIIEDVGFKPKWVGVKSGSDISNSWHRTDVLEGDLSHPVNQGAIQSGHISSLEELGFSTGPGLNHASEVYFWIAIADPGTPTDPDGSGGGGSSNNRSDRIIAPVIASIFPEAGRPGIEVDIYGSNFGDNRQSGFGVYFNNIQATRILSWSDTKISVIVPSGDVAGNALVVSAGGASAPYEFGVPPIIKSIEPASAVPGNRLTIRGQHFGDHKHDNRVYVDGFEATKYFRWSTEAIVVEVPDVQSDSDVYVVTNAGTSNKRLLNIALDPVIDEILPKSVPQGGYVTLTGSNFGAKRFETVSKITVGNTELSTNDYLLWDDNSILIKLPTNLGVGRYSLEVETAAGLSNPVAVRVFASSDQETSATRPLLGNVSPNPVDIAQLDEIDYTWTVAGANFSQPPYLEIHLYNNDVGWIDTEIIKYQLSDVREYNFAGSFVDVRIAEPYKLTAGVYDLVVSNTDLQAKSVQAQALTILDLRIPDAGLIGDEQAATDEENLDDESEPTSGVVDDHQQGSTYDLVLRQYQNITRLFQDLWGDITRGLFNVNQAYQYELVEVDPSAEVVVDAGETASVQITVRNTGTLPWYNSGDFHMHLGTVGPRDRISQFRVPNRWMEGDNRAATLEESTVRPGEIGTFVVPLLAPDIPGSYVERFAPVAEHLAWLSGPDITLNISVR